MWNYLCIGTLLFCDCLPCLLYIQLRILELENFRFFLSMIPATKGIGRFKLENMLLFVLMLVTSVHVSLCIVDMSSNE